MEHLIERFGYAAVLVGTFFEGETILVLGGFAAQQEHLRLPFVILAAIVGSAAGDQFWFLLGRRYGRSYVEGRPRLRARLDRATRLLERYPTLFILGFRFVYGIRNVAPVAIALSRVPARRFMALNLAAAVIWSVVGAGAGYVFGHAIEAVLGDLRLWEERILAAAALAGIVLLTVQVLRARRKGKPPD